ncbi:MAG: choice-of-anchor Q domain-containing protein [Saprospiraceae bacterium]|nr:choice-of-anchor Q domain-containing protein [Saprospiraceae bacterium]
MLKFLLPLCLALCSPLLRAQNIIYVNQNATGNQSGISWNNAYTNLQVALKQAKPGDQVWVCKGTYYPTTDGNRDSSFLLPNKVKLWGGFAGFETNLTQRNWETHSTILSGDIGLANDSTDNSYNVIRLINTDSSTVLDGFIIEKGVAIYDGQESIPPQGRQLCGGGLYIMGEDGIAFPRISNCLFRQNAATNYGGGVCINGKGSGLVAPTFFNCQFLRNICAVDGGGVYRYGSGNLQSDPIDFKQCLFKQNFAGRNGAGLYFQDLERKDTLHVLNCLFLQNTALRNGGGLYLNLGRSSGSMVKVNGSDFISNVAAGEPAFTAQADNFGYTKYMEFSECNIKGNYIKSTNTSNALFKAQLIPLDSNSRMVFKKLVIDSTFSDFLAVNSSIVIMELPGAAAYFEDCIINTSNTLSRLQATATNIIFKRSVMIGPSPQIFVGKMTLAVDKTRINVIVENSSFVNTSSENLNSQAIHVSKSNLKINNCRFISYANIFLSETSDIDNHSNAIFNNCILFNINSWAKYTWENRYEEIPIQFSNSFFNKSNDFCSITPYITCGSGNLYNVDPQFVDIDNLDFHLQACSPLVDAGDNTVAAPGDLDLEGNPRILNNTIDIGPLELTAPVLVGSPQVTPACPQAKNGTVAFELQRGCAPFTYNWVSGGTQGQNITQLAAGYYQITITDARGVTVSSEFTIPVGSPVQLIPSPTPIVCGDTFGGTAAVHILNGVAPYQYAWQGFSSTDSLLENLPVGSYPVTVTDALGCVASGAVNIQTSGFLDISIDVQEISCPGAKNGALTITPTNGKQPYSWLWENGSKLPVLSPIGPGTYNGTVTDALGCTIQWILPLSDPQPIHAEALIVSSTDGMNPNGSIELTSISGGSGIFEVSWSTGVSGLQISNLTPGDYTVTITDSKGCSVVETFAVDSTVSTTLLNTPSRVIIYPNPAQDFVQVQAEESGIFTIYNALNVCLIAVRTKDNLTRVQISTLPAGGYFWEFRGPMFMERGFLVKSR